MRPPAPWTLLDVELADRSGPFAPEITGPAVVWFRLDGAVLGERTLLPADLPMSAAEFADFAAPAIGWALERLTTLDGGDDLLLPVPPTLAPPAPGTDRLAGARAAIAARRSRPVPVDATIVVCSCQRAAELAECLDALSGEVGSGREVIVVDNGPDLATEAVVRARPGIGYVAEPRRGLSRARNTGVEAASGEVVVFVDDDVRPEPGWVDALLRCFDAPDVAVVCGLALPHSLAAEAEIAFQYDLGFGGMGHVPVVYDHRFREAWPNGVPVWRIGAGANMAVRRRTVLALGGFDERLGPGAAGGCGDDSEFWHRALFAGHRAIYEPLSVVRHQHRSDMAALRRQAYGYGFGHVVALLAQYGRSRDAGDLRRAFGTMPFYLARKALRWPREALAGRADPLLGSWIRGYFAGLGHLRLAFGTAPVPAMRERENVLAE